MARLLLSNSTTLPLQADHNLILGRANFPVGPEAVLVSRQQCEVMLVAGPGSPAAPPRLQITSLARDNPTVIQRRRPGSVQEQLLYQGQSTVLELSDRILLLKTQPSAYVEFQNSAAGRLADEDMTQAEPDLKRPRLEGACDGVGALGSRDTDAAAPAAGPARHKPVVVVLVGLPGSGKSTFCAALQRASALPWTRVNQDTIREGRRGTRPQCVVAARTALLAASNVLIDRTNFDAAQRSDFLQLAQQLGCQAHAVVLKLPVKLCVTRATERQNHEGDLQGAGAALAVQRMNSQMLKAGMPSAQEGFASIMVCETEAQVERALAAWSSYAPGGRAAISLWAASNPLQRAWATRRSALPTRPLKPTASWQHPPTTATAPSVRSDAHENAVASSADAGSNAAVGVANTAAGGDRSQHSAAADDSHSTAAVPAAAVSPPAAERLCAPDASISSSLQSARAGAQQRQQQPRSNFGGAWQEELRRVAMDPEASRSKHPQLYVDERCVRFPDAYPKARHHALVVARDPALEGPNNLRRHHILLLQHMQHVGQQWVDEVQAQHTGLVPFEMGFHSIPSMRQLHLHIISQDFDSPCLKNKKHWNSFTTPFFLDIASVIQILQMKGRLDIDRAAAEHHLKEDLRCHKCRAHLKTMPALKTHIASCRQ